MTGSFFTFLEKLSGRCVENGMLTGKSRNREARWETMRVSGLGDGSLDSNVAL